MKKSRGLGKRLKRERESLGLSKTEVAKDMGFSNYQTLSYIENGSREVKAWELFKLAGIYGRSPEYFYQPPQKEPLVLWRLEAGAKEDPLVKRKFLDLCGKYQRLLELTGEHVDEMESRLPAPSKSGFLRDPFGYSVRLAEKYRRLLNLGGRPALSLVDVLESYAGVKVIFLDMGKAGSGASTVGDFGKGILINSSDAPWRRNYDLAHELFHIVTWSCFSPNEHLSATGKHPVDTWADAFASVLLLPEEETRAEFSKRLEKKRISYPNVVEMARGFGVSTDALLWRLVNLGLIRKKEVQSSLEKGEIRQIDREKRKPDRDTEKPHLSKGYINLAIKAFQMGKLSKAKLAEYLDIPFSEVSSFMRRRGFDEEEDYSTEFSAT
jgi:Zn-dependent peptidase ImmA (M78 family)/DNA-binding XRE family transcriptional regulator